MTSYGRIFELWSIYNEPHVHAHDVYNMYIHVHPQVKDKYFPHYVFYSYKLHDVVAIHTLAFGKLQRLFLFVCKVCTYTLKAVKPKSKFEIQIFENVKNKLEKVHVNLAQFMCVNLAQFMCAIHSF